MPFEIPEQCTLPTAERPIRLGEFDALLSSATSAARDDATHLTFSFADAGTNAKALEARARDLTNRECDCCSFFEFTVARDAGQVTVGIQVPDQHTRILDSLERRIGQRA